MKRHVQEIKENTMFVKMETQKVKLSFNLMDFKLK